MRILSEKLRSMCHFPIPRLSPERRTPVSCPHRSVTYHAPKWPQNIKERKSRSPRETKSKGQISEAFYFDTKNLSSSCYILQLITRKTHFLKLIFQLPKENCLLNGWLQSQSIFDVLPQLVMCGCLVSILKFCVFFHSSFIRSTKQTEHYFFLEHGGWFAFPHLTSPSLNFLFGSFADSCGARTCARFPMWLLCCSALLSLLLIPPFHCPSPSRLPSRGDTCFLVSPLSPFATSLVLYMWVTLNRKAVHLALESPLKARVSEIALHLYSGTWPPFWLVSSLNSDPCRL